MQTFLPYPNFEQSARCLDRKRLGKQRGEAKQILMILRNDTAHWKDPDAWQNHTAVLMWVNFPYALAEYGRIICDEWIRRGFVDNTKPYFTKRKPLFEVPMPPWLGREDIHASHRSRLLEKDFDWYSQFGWKEEPGTEYVWPYRKMETA